MCCLRLGTEENSNHAHKAGSLVPLEVFPTNTSVLLCWRPPTGLRIFDQSDIHGSTSWFDSYVFIGRVALGTKMPFLGLFVRC